MQVNTAAPLGSLQLLSCGFWRLFVRAKFIMVVWIHARFLCLRLPKRMPFSAMIDLLDHVYIKPPDHFTTEQIATLIQRVTRRPWLMRDRRCLRQGFLAYWCFRSGGYQPVIHFDIDTHSLKTSKVSAHCWVTINDIPVMSHRLPNMRTLFVFPPQPEGSSANPT